MSSIVALASVQGAMFALRMQARVPRPALQQISMSEPGTPNASPSVDTLRRSLESPSAVFSSPRRAIVYSDRYIPSRATSSRLDFSMLDRERVNNESPVQPEREDANPAYRNMLRQTLLGCAFASLLLLRRLLQPCCPARGGSASFESALSLRRHEVGVQITRTSSYCGEACFSE